MIAAQELRIGNYVEVECRHIPVLNGQEIDYGHAVQLPIPLTTEILEKCGFEKSSMWNCLTNRIDEYGLLNIYLDTLSYGLFDTQSGDEYRSWDNRIEYLHQLQNLYFALTQTELTYNP